MDVVGEVRGVGDYYNASIEKSVQETKYEAKGGLVKRDFHRGGFAGRRTPNQGERTETLSWQCCD